MYNSTSYTCRYRSFNDKFVVHLLKITMYLLLSCSSSSSTMEESSEGSGTTSSSSSEGRGTIPPSSSSLLKSPSVSRLATSESEVWITLRKTVTFPTSSLYPVCDQPALYVQVLTVKSDCCK